MFVTGFHGAGTRACAAHLSETTENPLVSEEKISFNHFNKAVSFNGIIHCPGLAHRTLELSKYGLVYWCDREKAGIINYMKRKHFEALAKQVLQEFGHTLNGYDPIVELIHVKELTYRNSFKPHCIYVRLEHQPYYSETLTHAWRKRCTVST